MQIDKDKLSFIKEEVYVTGTCPELDLLIIGNKKDSEHIIGDMILDYTHLVYIDLPSGIEIVKLSQSNEPYVLEIKFIDHILQLPQVTLNDLTYLCTLYGRVDNKLFQPYSGKIKCLEAFLKSTYGKLIYVEQAIELYKMYKKCSEDEAKDYIKEVSTNYPNLIYSVFTHEEKNYNLYELWNEYTYGDRVFNPRAKIAKRIYDLIIQNNKN